MKLPEIIINLFQKNSDLQKGFTLLEAVVTVSIMGILAAVVTPTYLETQTEAKLVMSQSNATQLKQGIVNIYLSAFLDGNLEPVWPDEPTDNKMTHQWAETTTLYDGRTINQLFSNSAIVYNPYGKPFLYYLLPETEHELAGFRIDDPDTGVSISFRP